MKSRNKTLLSIETRIARKQITAIEREELISRIEKTHKAHNIMTK